MCAFVFGLRIHCASSTRSRAAAAAARATSSAGSKTLKLFPSKMSARYWISPHTQTIHGYWECGSFVLLEQVRHATRSHLVKGATAMPHADDLSCFASGNQKPTTICEKQNMFECMCSSLPLSGHRCEPRNKFPAASLWVKSQPVFQMDRHRNHHLPGPRSCSDASSGWFPYARKTP